MKTLNTLKVWAFVLFICTIMVVALPETGECGIRKIGKGIVSSPWKIAKGITYPVRHPVRTWEWIKATTEHGRKLQAERAGKLYDDPAFQIHLSGNGVTPIWPGEISGFIPIRGKASWLTVTSNQPLGWTLSRAWLRHSTSGGKMIQTKIKPGKQSKIENRRDGSTDYSWVLIGKWTRTYYVIDEHGHPDWITEVKVSHTYGYYAKHYKPRRRR